MIGVFDSGFGGLTVLRHLIKDHPHYSYVYLGDNANVPYGNKSSAMIYDYSKKAVDFLYSQGCQLIIFACNSASAQALHRIQQEYLLEKYPKNNLKVLGVVRPMVEKISSQKNIKRLGIIGTRATINSAIYEQELAVWRSDIKIFSLATPLLVPLIEETWLGKVETKMILKKYLRKLKLKQIDALVLACTHYPILIKDISRIMGKNCLVLDPGKIVSESLADYLNRHSEIKLKSSANRFFYSTDQSDKFRKEGKIFLGEKIENFKTISL